MASTLLVSPCRFLSPRDRSEYHSLTVLHERGRMLPHGRSAINRGRALLIARLVRGIQLHLAAAHAMGRVRAPPTPRCALDVRCARG